MIYQQPTRIITRVEIKQLNEVTPLDLENSTADDVQIDRDRSEIRFLWFAK